MLRPWAWLQRTMKSPEPISFLGLRVSRASGALRLVVALWLLSSAVTTFAGGVVTSGTEASLRAALNGGGLVTFSNDFVIVISQQIVINQAATTIDSAGHNIVIATSNSVPLLNAATNLTLKGITLVGGSSSTAGGALYVNAGVTAIASGCVFSGNSAIGTNGLSGMNGSTNSNGTGGNGTAGFQGTTGTGGAIFNAGTLTLLNCSLTNNAATGGAGGAGGTGGPGGGTFSIGGNGGDGAPGGAGLGGAVYNAGDLTIINCTLSSNSATGGAGGQGGASGSGRYAGLTGNGGMGGNSSGGAIFNAGNLTVVASTFAMDSALGGTSATAGMHSNGTGMTGITGGSAAGGALYNNWWSVVTNSTFYTNTVTGGSGGNGGNGGGTFAVPGNGGNGGNGTGGAIANANSMTLVNCTLSTGGAFGGTNGIAGTGNSTASAGQRGAAQAGNLVNSGPSLVVMNSILAAAVSGGNAAGDFTDGGYNLSSDTVSSLGPSSFQGLNPKLGPLAANGGPTLTMALLTNSPAIDKIPPGAAPSTDERGFPRPINGSADIGAFEFGSAVTATNIVLSIAKTTNGLVQLSGGGTPGLNYVVQASTNLATWQNISTNPAPVVITQPFTNLPALYYRLSR